MNFSCDNCQRRYTIADEKVRGRAVRIRCKACQHLMSVGPLPEPDPAAFEPAPVEDSTRMVSLDALEKLRDQTRKPAAAAARPAAANLNPWEDEPTRAASPAEAGALWFVSAHGKQIGPFASGALADKVRSGEIQPRNFMWKKGMTDWKRGVDIPELAGLLSGGAPAPAPPPAFDAPQDFGAAGAWDAEASGDGGFDPGRSAETSEAAGASDGGPVFDEPAPAPQRALPIARRPTQDLDAGSLFSDLELSKVVRMADLSDIRKPSAHDVEEEPPPAQAQAPEPARGAKRAPSDPPTDPRGLRASGPSRPAHTPTRGTVAMSANSGSSGFRKFLAALLLLIALIGGAATAIHERLVPVPPELQAQVDEYWPLPAKRAAMVARAPAPVPSEPAGAVMAQAPRAAAALDGGVRDAGVPDGGVRDAGVRDAGTRARRAPPAP